MNTKITKLRIRDLNPHIVCSLCAGYFIDATTITECLHAFCRSCIIKHLSSSPSCPQCGTKVHETQPLNSLKSDRVLQDIVFKLVPGLWLDELKRVEQFTGLKTSDQMITQAEPPSLTSEDPLLDSCPFDEEEENGHLYSFDPLLSFQLLPFDEEKLKLKSPMFAKCSERTCLIHVKRMILGLNINEINQPIREQMNNESIDLEIIELFDWNKKLLTDSWTSLRKLWISRAPLSDEPILIHFNLKVSDCQIKVKIYFSFF